MTQRTYKVGLDRQQGFLLPPSIDEYISADHPVRAIEAYVDSLDLEALGFRHTTGERTPGQPAFPPAALLKLYLYGYLHRVRSSRRLEAECQRNLEVIWLLAGLRPGYKTLADFRKQNLEALQQTNRDFVQLCRELDLFGGELVGIDGSFFRGNVAKRRIFTTERLRRTVEHIEQDIAHYLQDLAQADRQEGEPTVQTEAQFGEKLTRLRERQAKRGEQLAQLVASGETQLAEVDPAARLLRKPGSGTVAGYNVQTAVDAKHKLIVLGVATCDGNDERQLAPMAQAAQAVLGVSQLIAVADQGYFNAQHIRTCQASGITPYVPEPDKQAYVRQQNRFPRDAFTYDPQANRYCCPAGEFLNQHARIRKGDKMEWRYRSTPARCGGCALKTHCLPRKMPYRTVTRWEHEDLLQAHRERMKTAGAEKMRTRSSLCEHPFGTLKSWCGWTHFLLRGLGKVQAELSLLVLCYNFKRVLSIVGLAAFRSYCGHRQLIRLTLNG